MAFISFNTRVAEHRTRFVCLGETPSPRVRCLLRVGVVYLLTYLRPAMLFRSESLVPLMVIDVSPPPLSIVGSRRPAPSPTWGVGTTFPSTTVHAHDMPMTDLRGRPPHYNVETP